MAQQTLLSVMAAVTLLTLIAAVLGAVALVLQQRRVDLGIRYALGAGRPDVRRLIWRDITVVVIGGAALGTIVAWGAGRVMGQYWYGVAPLDSLTTSAVLVTLVLLVALATEWRVRRFAFVSPFNGLKDD